MSEIELKACPFCGGEAESYYHLNGVVEISCSSNECEVRPTLNRSDDGYAGKAWNTRADGWISVGERLPKIDTSRPAHSLAVYVIGFDSATGAMRGLAYRSNGYAKTEKGRAARFEEYDGRLALLNVTHWMPLPEPPL